MEGYRVEYTKNGDEVCIIPEPTIPFDDFRALSEIYIEQGYKYWIPADHRRGYRFSKVIPEKKEETPETIVWRN